MAMPFPFRGRNIVCGEERGIMQNERQNCWQFMRCGREPGGSRVEELGICPAASDGSYDGINRGLNAGRICWAVAGTFCGGQVQGKFADKRSTCVRCDFFKLVRSQEEKEGSSSKFLKYITESSGSSFLNQLTFRRVKPGERFVVQGEQNNEGYIIRSGTCLTIVEKNGTLHPVGHRGSGDIVGVRSLLTGEPCHAHVEAETEMQLWVLNREQVNSISLKDPELIPLLTEMVVNQFDSKRPVADRVIGKYIATDIIGRGAHAIVYKGMHQALDMPVAIKMMRHHMVMDPVFLESFRNEAKIIGGLNHENILKVHDIEERYKTVFIIMEYLDGESLASMLRRIKAMTPSAAADYLFQICSGLRYAHEKGIVHRDINPNNIMVQHGTQIKILDFGMACPPGTDDDIMGGVFAYQAPELFAGEPANQRSDIYSLGITAYELVTGRRPYREDDLRELLRLRETQEIPDPAELVPEIPLILRNFILKACRLDPGERYRNVAEAMEELRPLVRPVPVRRKQPGSPMDRLTSLILRYGEDQQEILSYLVEEFTRKAEAAGIHLKMTDLNDS